jgi:hypothetical protein
MKMEDAPQDIGKDQFVNDFEKYIVLYRSALMDYTEDNTPVDGSKFKLYLGEKLGKDSYNISEVLWQQAIKDIGDSTTTKAAIASKIRENLLFYTDNDSKEIKALVSSRRKKFPKLSTKKTLDGVLPTKEAFIAALKKDYAEDKKNPKHPDLINYTEIMKTWSAKIEAMWSFQAKDGEYKDLDIVPNRLIGKLKKIWGNDAYFLGMAAAYKNGSSGLPSEGKGSDVCEWLSQMTKNYATLTNIQKSFNSEKYKDTLDVLLSSIEVKNETYGNLILASSVDAVSNEPDYAKFTELLETKINTFVTGITKEGAELSEELVSVEKLAEQSKLIATDGVPVLITNTLQAAFKSLPKIPTGGELVTGLKTKVRTLSGNKALYEAWKDNKLKFPLAVDYATAIGKSTEEVDAAIFIAAFDKWKQKVEGIELRDLKLERPKLETALKNLFTQTHGDFDKGSFLYEQLLQPSLSTVGGKYIHTNSNKIEEVSFSSLWKGMFEKCDTTLLTHAYNAYRGKTNNVTALKNYVSTLDSIYPSQQFIITACEGAKFVPEPKEELLIDTDRRDTLEIIYVISWKDRASVISGAVDSATEEVLANPLIGKSVELLNDSGIMDTDIAKDIVNTVQEEKRRLEVKPVENDTITLKIPWFWNKADATPYLDIGKIGVNNLLIKGASFYGLKLSGTFSKMDSPIIQTNRVIHKLEFKLTATNVQITDELAFIAGHSEAPNPSPFDLPFELEIVSTYINGGVNVEIDAIDGTPNTNDCPMIRKVIPPVLENPAAYMNMNPFPSE